MLLAAKNQNLRRIRLEAGLSQEELAEVAQVSAASVGRMERGQHDAQPRTKRQVTLALNGALGRTRKRGDWIELTDIFPMGGE